MSLPTFTYHPDPISTGSIEESDEFCQVCGVARGYVYTGPIYGELDFDGPLCPWCIADGSAHDRLGLAFTDPTGVGGFGYWDDVPQMVRDEIVFRTPGFSSWQSEKWFTHCDDAAMFLGPVGYRELQRFGVNAVATIAHEAGVAESDEYMRTLDRDGAPTAYLFQCRHCGVFGGYSDSH